MANVINSTYMNLPIPVQGVDFGPDYANNVNASLATIDSHNHSSGQGQQIGASGINIATDFTFNNNNAINLHTARFYPQAALVTSASPNQGCLFVYSNELYYNDVSGNQVKITNNGSIVGAAGTISGLPSGTASAAYGSSTFTFQSATNTPAYLNVGPISIGLHSASSNTVTLSPPSSVSGGSYSLVLPAIPGVKSIMAMDATGNITAPYTVDNSTLAINGSNQLYVKASGITTTQIASSTIVPSNLGTISDGITINQSGSGSTLQSIYIAPITTVLGSGAGGYSLPTSGGRSPVYLRIRMVGGGGGGGSGGNAGGSAGSSGTATNFYVAGQSTTSFLVANAGQGGVNGGAGGVGGNYNVNYGTSNYIGFQGGSGSGSGTGLWATSMATTAYIAHAGGCGGCSVFGGAGGGGYFNASGLSATTGTGSGGGGGGSASVYGTQTYGGSGGGAGGYLEEFIYNPVSNYSYIIGGGGLGGSSSTNGGTGGNGGSGIIIIDAYFQ